MTAPGYHDDKAAIAKRLHRIEGQVRGIQRMVEEDQYCIDILTQVSAATKALQSVAKGEVDLGAGDHSAESAAQGDFADLLTWLQETLTEQVKEVRLSTRLTSSTETAGGASSSTIVPVACVRAGVSPSTELSVSRSVWSSSSIVSPPTGTSTCPLVWPGANVSVPDVAV